MAQGNPQAGPTTHTPPPARHGRLGLLVRGMSWQTLAQVLPLVVNIVLTRYTVEHYGQARYGLMLFSTVIMAMVGILDGGVGQSALRFFNIYLGAKNQAAINRLLVNSVGLLTVIIVPCFALVFWWSPEILIWANTPPELLGESTVLLRTLTVMIGISLIRQPCQSLLFAHNRYPTASMAWILGHVIYSIGIIASIHTETWLYGLAATYVAQQTVATLIMVLPCRRYVTRDGMRLMVLAEWTEFFRFIWRTQVVTAINMFTIQKDSFLINKLVGVDVAPIYVQGSQFAIQLRQMPLNAQAPIQGILGSTYGESGRTAAAAHFAKLQRFWALGITGWTALGIPAAYYGLGAWLPEFEHAGAVAAILLLGYFFVLMSVVLRLWLLTVDRPDLDMQFSVALFVSNVVLTVGFAWLWGPFGSVWATTCSGIIGLAYLMWATHRTAEADLGHFWRGVAVFPALAAGLLTWGLEHLLFPLWPVGALGLLACAATAAPGALLYTALTFGPRTSYQWVRAKLGT